MIQETQEDRLWQSFATKIAECDYPASQEVIPYTFRHIAGCPQDLAMGLSRLLYEIANMRRCAALVSTDDLFVGSLVNLHCENDEVRVDFSFAYHASAHTTITRQGVISELLIGNTTWSHLQTAYHRHNLQSVPAEMIGLFLILGRHFLLLRERAAELGALIEVQRNKYEQQPVFY